MDSFRRFTNTVVAGGRFAEESACARPLEAAQVNRQPTREPHGVRSRGTVRRARMSLSCPRGWCGATLQLVIPGANRANGLSRHSLARTLNLPGKVDGPGGATKRKRRGCGQPQHAAPRQKRLRGVCDHATESRSEPVLAFALKPCRSGTKPCSMSAPRSLELPRYLRQLPVRTRASRTKTRR